MRKYWMTSVLCLTVVLLCSSPAATAQDRAWNDCVRRAAVASGVPESAVYARIEKDNRGSDTYILNWEVRGTEQRRQVGYCEVDRRTGSIVSFETNPYREEGDRPRPYSGEYPHVRVDTDGKGYFTNRSLSSDRLDRGYVDTKERASVSLRGRNGFRVTFYGVVVDSDGRRELTMRITHSDQGEARGEALIRLNKNRDEVEWINLRGRMVEGGEFSAEFNRNR